MLYKQLLTIIDTVYRKAGIICTQPEAEPESTEYGAYTFTMNDKFVRYRMAKITPTKTGQFVTLWKRKGDGPIEPFHLSDDMDICIITVKKNERFGQFIIPKTVLFEKGVLSGNGKEGKRAIRVYPPWDNTTSKQAQKTQQWQSDYFLEIPENKSVDVMKLRTLIG